MVSTLNGIVDVRVIATLLILAILGAIAVSLTARRLRDKRARHLIVLAPTIDVTVFAFLYVRNSDLVGDAQLWHYLATIAANVIGSGGALEFPAALAQEGKDGYIWILGALYFLGGPAPTLGICLNMICRAITVAIVALTTQDLIDAGGGDEAGSRSASVIAGGMAAILPCFAFWSSQLLREAITIATIAIAVHFLTRFIITRKVIFLVASVPAMLLLTWVRETLGVSVSIALLAGTTYSALGASRLLRQVRGLLAVAAIPAIPTLLVVVLNIIGVDQSRISNTTAELSLTASSGFPGLAFGLPPAQVLLITFPRVIAGPFPWELSFSPVMLLALMELACWWLVAGFAIRGSARFRRGRLGQGSVHTVTLLLVVAAALILGLSIVVGNYGILARFRPMITVALIPLAAAGLMKLNPSRSPEPERSQVARNREPKPRYHRDYPG